MQPNTARAAEQRVEVTDNLEELLEVLPPRIREPLLRHQQLDRLIEVVCDLGRLPEGRFPDGVTVLDNTPIEREDLAARECNKVLICDTDPLATSIWQERYMDEWPTEVRAIAATRLCCEKDRRRPHAQARQRQEHSRFRYS